MKIEYDKILRERIQPLVNIFSEFNKTDPSNIDTKKRYREIVQVRQMVYYYLKSYSKLSNAVIAAIFNQDHATCYHGYKTIGNLIETNVKFKEFDNDKGDEIKKFIKNMINGTNHYIKELEKRKTELEILLYHGCI